MKALMIDQCEIQNRHLPQVIFDKDKGIFKLYGYIYSYKEEVDEHFERIYQWIDAYLKEPNLSSDFYFCFQYVHSYGIKCLVNLILKIKALPSLQIFWLIYPGDRDWEELVHDISEELGIEIIVLESDKTLSHYK